MEIKKAARADLALLVELEWQLWPDQTAEELAQDLEGLLQQPDAAFFLGHERGEPVGFAQCQLRRDYVEGTESSPVGYLEGIFVVETYRGNGVAGQLLNACEDWAREHGCREFASDCELNNDASLRFHLHTGFSEANRIVCFTKKL